MKLRYVRLPRIAHPTARFISLFLFFASSLLLFNQIALAQEPSGYAPNRRTCVARTRANGLAATSRCQYPQ